MATGSRPPADTAVESVEAATFAEGGGEPPHALSSSAHTQTAASGMENFMTSPLSAYTSRSLAS